MRPCECETKHTVKHLFVYSWHYQAEDNSLLGGPRENHMLCLTLCDSH